MLLLREPCHLNIELWQFVLSSLLTKCICPLDFIDLPFNNLKAIAARSLRPRIHASANCLGCYFLLDSSVQ